MPRITAKVEGRGNGIKTVLTNIIEVAASLNREAPEITKFFGCELGSQTTYAADTERAVVNGNHGQPDLQTNLSKYIELFVLCKQCRLPETSYRAKGGIIFQKCAACGSKDPCDMTHKLTTFILNQYKKTKEASKEKEKEKEKGEKKKAKKSKEEPKDAEADEAETTDQVKPEKKPKKEKSDKEKKKKKKKEGEEDGAANEGENTENSKVEDDDETDSKAVEAGIERFTMWRTENPTATIPQITEELRSIQTFNALSPADRIIIFLGSVFTETSITDNTISHQKEILSALAPTPIQQRHLISACEWFCGTKYPKLLKFFPVILKHIYDEELVEEDILLEWAADYTRNDFTSEQSLISMEVLEQLKAAARPFITWLQEAEEDDDEGEEDEEEEEG